MSELDDIVIITEVDRGPAFANHIFQRKYRQDVPDFEHHVIAFYRKATETTRDASVRKLLTELAEIEAEHESLAHKLGETILTKDVRATDYSLRIVG